MTDRWRWGGRVVAGVGTALVLLLTYQLRTLVLAAAQLFGPWGLLFAVPAAAVLRVLVPELWSLLRQVQVEG